MARPPVRADRYRARRRLRRVRPAPRPRVAHARRRPAGAEIVAAEEDFLGARVRALMVRLARRTRRPRRTRAASPRSPSQVGEELGLPPARLRTLAIGGLLHDIGKLSTPNAILKKPGALDDQEFARHQAAPRERPRPARRARRLRRRGPAGSSSTTTSGSTAAATRAGSTPGSSTSRRGSSRSATSTTRSSRPASTAAPGPTSARWAAAQEIGKAFDPGCVDALVHDPLPGAAFRRAARRTRRRRATSARRLTHAGR